jgi:predicted NBD/HSP70 family sugar kinase
MFCTANRTGKLPSSRAYRVIFQERPNLANKEELPTMLAAHGASRLTEVDVDDYNAEMTDKVGFVGDRANGRAFRSILEAARDQFRKLDEDPIGEVPSSEISKKQLDRLLIDGDAAAAGLVVGAIEEFARTFAEVIRQFLRLKAWKDTQRIVIGGGLRASRTGELAIGRTAVLLRTMDLTVELIPIRHHPDEAGLIGCTQLAPSWMFSGHDGILAVDIGGANIRVGIVQLNARKSPDLAKSKVIESELWRHADDGPDREAAVQQLVVMLKAMIKRADKKKVRLAPFVGIACPGRIREDGSIERGSQNLPGDWEHKSFNLPALLRAAIPDIDGHEMTALMHNDAVVQGLSEVASMKDIEHWGVMTIGTGLGNARFTNRRVAGNSRAGAG